jgi:preprotein translocase subunit SecY
MQLLTIAIPKLEEMQRDGADGRKKIASITRYVTVGLALIESGAMAIGFGRQGLLATYNVINVITVITALTAGSAFLMWIGERITENGVGNGISIVLTINILSRMPQDITSLFEQFVIGKSIAKGVVAAIIIIGIILLMVVLVIVLNDGVRKIPVQYAKKIQGRKMVGGQTTNIPLKVNTSGVIPVIFASSLLQLPIIICSLFGVSGSGIGAEILKVLNSNYWCNPDNLVYSIGLVVYIVLVIFFAYFYTSITFNPLEIS